MDDNFLKVAKKAALEAGKVILKYYGNFGERMIKGKDNSNFVTKADIEAEVIITKILTANFPDHNIIGEEGGKTWGKSEFLWAIDPVDGTFAYTHNIPQFCISIGLLKKDKPVVGVINEVLSNELVWAEEGKGAYLNSKRIQTSQDKRLEQAGIYTDFGNRESRQIKHDLYIEPLVDKVGRIFSLGSTALAHAWVGKGSLDGSVAQAWIWDFVAGAVIVREAGGKVTDFEGNEPDWSKERLNIVATNGLIHDQILEALNK